MVLEQALELKDWVSKLSLLRQVRNMTRCRELKRIYKRIIRGSYCLAAGK